MPSPDDRWLLVSDVDNTVVAEGPDDAGAAQRLAAYLEARRERIAVVYNSGRFVDSILETVAEHGLARPDVCVGGVGTEVRVTCATGLDAASAERLTAWPITTADAWDPQRVRAVVGGVEGAELQPADYQSPHKISYYLRGAEPHTIAEIEGALASAGLDARVVYSSSRDLDVLPGGVDKAAAAAFVARSLGYPDTRVVAAGDSGNDRAMLSAGFRAVVVANAKPELDDLAGPGVFRAPSRYGDGVIEGLEHWLGADAVGV
ncbi:MAG: HAD-IIB family hydrolase [Planctomycetota bacterium]